MAAGGDAEGGDAVARGTGRALRFAGVALDQPRVMGVVNVTPDSFSDGGEAYATDAAVARGLSMARAGADFVDVGGESTRPGSEPVPLADELHRVVPVVSALAAAGVRVSVDTRRPEVMAAALDAGAAIVNDITALGGDPRSLPLIAERRGAVVLMHMQGEPRTMQRDPRYQDAARDVCVWLASRLDACLAAGIPRERIALDPGIGFGKTLAHNLRILAHLGLYRPLGCALLIGVSRKSFIARLSGDAPVQKRLPGSLAAGLAAVARGAHILRVHDVEETLQAVAIWRAISAAESGESELEFDGARV
ncbi:MAG: dihydropteroate synthase [Rhodospirillales bacterium]|nr:dihydropteroate synthase [Rhodospirillales bacterium]